MKNELENFIKENKKSFEERGPSDQLWNRISAELDQQELPKKSFKLSPWISVAAILLVSFGIYFNYKSSPGSTKEIEIAQVSPEFGRKEVRFTNQIEEKKDSLAVYAKANPELYEEFTTDLKKLDAEYDKLKMELQKTPNQLFIVKAMVKNREIQLQLLQQQLLIINQVNQYKKETLI